MSKVFQKDKMPPLNAALLAIIFFSLFFETLRYFLLHICAQILPSFPRIFLLTPISASLLSFHFLNVSHDNLSATYFCFSSLLINSIRS